jgi:hypothetical protein
MENLEWKCEHEVISLDVTKKVVIRSNITDNPHDSLESYESFDDFLRDKKLTAMTIKSYFSLEIYDEIIREIKKYS